METLFLATSTRVFFDFRTEHCLSFLIDEAKTIYVLNLSQDLGSSDHLGHADHSSH